jgi:AAA15 family ATPase/GTPase
VAQGCGGSKIMLREYQLTNFKAFGEPETIPIRPITLIYGPNSSGKSSVLQSLLLLKQTLQEAENSETLLIPKGNLINLGSYREFIHRHDVSKPFSFKVILALDINDLKSSSLLGKRSEHLLKNNLLGLQFGFDYDKNISNIILSNVQLFIGDDPSPAAIYKPHKRDSIENENTSSFFHGSMQFSVGDDEFPPDIEPDINNFQDLDIETREEIASFLKLDSINYQHSLWKEWWQKYSSLLSIEAEKELKIIFEKLKLHEGCQGWQNKKWMDLLAEKSKDLKNALENSESLEPENIKDQLSQLESLKRLGIYFNNYSFDRAQDDLSNLTQYPCLSYRNFFPVKCLKIGKKESSNSEIWKLSEVYKHFWTPELSVLTMLASSGFRTFLNSIVYIGPLREYPERFYIVSDNLSKQVGKSGKLLPDILLKDPNILKLLNDQLARFGLEYELKVSPLKVEDYENIDFFALRLIDKYTGVNVSLADVGFGISQVLPIIVQSMLSRKSTLLIEQPEIHIHPRLQAELGSLLAECIKHPFDNQFIIETHSEHLMLRLQKLIRKGELKPDDVSVIYVDRGSNGSKCLHLRLDEEGDFIDEWPDGFFEEDFNEIFG